MNTAGRAVDRAVIGATFGLLFLVVGLPGLHAGGLTVTPYEVVLVVFTLMAATRKGAGGVLAGLWREKGIVLFIMFAVWIIVCTLFLKQLFNVGVSIAEFKEVKNHLLPAVMILLGVILVITDVRAGRNIVICGGIGLAGSLVIAAIRVPGMLRGIRPIPVMEFQDAVGFTYIWLGVAGAFVTVVGMVGLTEGVGERSRFLARLFFGAMTVFGAAMALVSGTRAVILGILGFPFLQLVSRPLPIGTMRMVVALALVAIVAVSLFPGMVASHVGSSRVRMSGAAVGAERLTEGDVYATDLGARILWWERIIYDNGIRGSLLGLDYKVAMNRVYVVAHPHSIFVWARILGGIPGALLLALSVGLLVDRALLNYATAGRGLGGMASVNLSVYLILLGVLLTNSWSGGTPLLFGVNAALTFKVEEWVREGRKRGEGVGGGKEKMSKVDAGETAPGRG